MNKNLIYNILLDLGLISFLLLIFMSVRSIFSWYGGILQSMQTELQLLGTNLQGGSVEALDVLEASLTSFNSQIQWIYILLFVITPLLIYLAYWLTSTIKLTKIINNKWWDWKIALTSLGWGLLFYIVFIILLNFFVTLFQEALLSTPNYILLSLLFLALLFSHFKYTLSMVALQKKGKFMKNIKKLYIKGFKNFHYYIPLLLTNIIIIIFLFWLFVKYATGTLVWMNLFHLFIVIIALILLNLEKNKFVTKVSQ